MRKLVFAFVTNHPRQVFSVAVQLLYILQYVSFCLENKMRNLIIVKYDNSDRIVICVVPSKHLQCVCRHIKSYPAGDRLIYHTTK